jgi:hypothetical protein
MAVRKGQKLPPRRGTTARHVAAEAKKLLSSNQVVKGLALEQEDVDKLIALSRSYVRGGLTQLNALKLRIERAYGTAPLRLEVDDAKDRVDLTKLSDKELELYERLLAKVQVDGK